MHALQGMYEKDEVMRKDLTLFDLMLFSSVIKSTLVWTLFHQWWASQRAVARLIKAQSPVDSLERRECLLYVSKNKNCICEKDEKESVQDASYTSVDSRCCFKIVGVFNDTGPQQGADSIDWYGRMVFIHRHTYLCVHINHKLRQRV